MKRFGTLAVLALMSLVAGPAAARSSFVNDGAGMFGASTVAALNTRVGNFNAQTGKEVLVETVDSTGGTPIKDAAQREFAQQNVNGVLIYIAKSDRKDYMAVDHAAASAGWFTSDISRSILQSMETQFRDGDFDGGITSAVGGVLAIYHQHVNSLPNRAGAVAPAGARGAYGNSATNGGFHLSLFWWIAIAIGAFLILRSLMRAASAPRYGPGMPGAPMPGAGYGGAGYGGGGGGGFFSGLLGGLGGAFLGNEIFGNRGGGIGGADQGAIGGGNAPDAGGWASDAGQADAGASSGGDWGGGGFGGDSGGGFGGGGGGGDAGGGW